MARINVQKVPTTEDRTLPIFAEFDRLADRIRLEAYNLFARRGGGGSHALDDWLKAERQVFWPAAKLAERDGAFVLEVALAGFEPSEISLTATPREIIVKANHEQTRGEEGATLRWSEFRSDQVFRRIDLPAAADVRKITANLKNGLLEVVAPKAEAALEATIKVPVTAPAGKTA